MASRRLGSTPFVELLPDSIAGDPTIRTASEALDPALAASVGAIPSLLLFARLGLVGGEGMLAPLARLAELSGGLSPLPEEVIDSLAWQFHVDGYEYAAGPEVKREMVLNSLLLHRRRGTPWAVRRALEIALRMPVTVREWFEAGRRAVFVHAGIGRDGLRPVRRHAGQRFTDRSQREKRALVAQAREHGDEPCSAPAPRPCRGLRDAFRDAAVGADRGSP